MVQGIAFQTRARTVDHLGREQIADCPTAISELWKNAYDAYARMVELHLFKDPEPVAAIVDDGHGMSGEEFQRHWLVVGTEAKATADPRSRADRNGLKPRPRQGQKGIGRLSCANLGPLLLLVSKRKDSPFIAALIDWRLFENPFLNLSDIQIPLVDFKDRADLFVELPLLAKTLSENVKGGREPGRSARISEAWSEIDGLKESGIQVARSEDIIANILELPFQPEHIEPWPVWTDASDRGTALLISGLNYDLRAQIERNYSEVAQQATRDRFFETLSSFVDPFVDPSDKALSNSDPQFSYAVRAWTNGTADLVVGSERQFDRRQIDDMEHRIVGRVGEDGVFTGSIRAFGKDLTDECVIPPPRDLTIPTRADTRVGPFGLYIASMEFTAINSTHTEADFNRYRDLANKYSGFMVFRDGLRVLPYGRTDNDFFEIESRRSKSAGREFWNHRQMFGRLSIGRETNPNLKDKAGREGLLDNHAAKTFREIVANVLQRSARLYFGSESSFRGDFLPDIREDNRRQKANKEREKLHKRQARAFRANLKDFAEELPAVLHEIESYVESLDITRERQIGPAKEDLDAFVGRLSDFTLPVKPKKLSARLESQYVEYRRNYRAFRTAVAALREKLEEQIEGVDPARPEDLLLEQLTRQGRELKRRLDNWGKEAERLQRAEYERVRELVKERMDAFTREAKPLLDRVRAQAMPYLEASAAMDKLKERFDKENRDILLPYITTLESLGESVDLLHLATFDADEVGELRAELDRLNSLAQLGIAVEIVAHDLQAFDDILADGLRRLPGDIRESKAAKDIEFAYEGLTDQLRFLSPLRLAGQKIQKWITGEEVFRYTSDFFKPILARNQIALEATDEFLRLQVFDQQSRLYPVFINLVNNSIYWLASSEVKKRRIIFGVIEDDVVVSDNGPGVDEEDVSNLFTLFFTRKARGGRGVGLYLCRANLSAGGHRIKYEANKARMPLDGANFLITFRGAKFGDV